ncbi:UTP--glucose-1-phosphate uridylyltransferase [Pelagicoccus mobilis]|uniref:UTP--glucose-1-phosphate uridylyltransferase n=1 Tax=Pelagicoccus mobilis TaxID=415221 RepID=A0A934VK53_9BACT|nr:UDPGP type 1 family protein [Pelagicoccus mobilis]MBK1876306.1 UTP--glucose-1-phosphate uridylyltransferase [Pelagicoccus mobilis]
MDNKQRFESQGQGQVFRFWDGLSEEEKANLDSQASEIDIEELDRLVATLVKSEEKEEGIDFSALEPAPYVSIPADLDEDEEWQEAKRIGEEALRAGKVAAFTVAGGQGTRLGYNGPKGTYPVTPVKNKTLFQVFAEKIQAARVAYSCKLPWFVMTSDINHEATVSFFEKNKYFGLAEGSVTFFRQGRMPAVDSEGKIILEAKGSIAMSPDGHGGALRALDRSGSFQAMVDDGIEVLSYFQVDNPLVQPVDPYFIGFHIKSGSTLSSKMLPKAYEKEKLGHFCVLDGVSQVVEYSDMPDELCALRDADGQLSFRAGSIAIHIISVDFARSLVAPGSTVALPFHRADKKIPFVDADGNTQKPDTPNGIKFEMFIFDSIPFAEKPLVIETTRLADFSPVKNAEGVDSPESCKGDQMTLFRQWFDAAGIELPADFDQSIEVSPLFATDEAGFVAAWKENPTALDLSAPIYIG